MARRKGGASARDRMEVASGKASSADRAEAGTPARQKGKPAAHPKARKRG